MRVILADDAVLIREGLVGLLQRQGHEVLAQPEDAEQMRVEVPTFIERSGVPDLLITDVRMPPHMGDDGLQAAITLREQFPDLPVMVLSQYIAPAYAERLFAVNSEAGAGYLLKERVGQVKDFMDACVMVANGGVVVDPTVARRIMSQGRGLVDLTPREREVLELMARGKSNADIARDLVVSPAAVAKHVSNIFLRLGLPASEENRRVRAILTYLRETGSLR